MLYSTRNGESTACSLVLVWGQWVQGLSTASSLQKFEIKKNLRAFSGFPFTEDSEEYQKKRAALEK